MSFSALVPHADTSGQMPDGLGGALDASPHRTPGSISGAKHQEGSGKEGGHQGREGQQLAPYGFWEWERDGWRGLGPGPQA